MAKNNGSGFGLFLFIALIIIVTSNHTRKEDTYEAVVTYGTHSATIYDDYDYIVDDAFSEKICIYYEEDNSENRDMVTLTDYERFEGSNFTKDGVHDSVLEKIGEEGKITYYDEKPNTLGR